MDEEVVDKILTEYWLGHYVSKEGFCILCTNTGMVSGVFCFCPNGRGQRSWSKKNIGDE